MANSDTVDYAQAGRDVLHLIADSPKTQYDDANALLEHGVTGARLFVGNQVIAANKPKLLHLKLTSIVFCQGEDGRCHFEGDPNFTYLKFPIGKLAHTAGVLDTPVTVAQTMRPLFQFVSERMNAGANVLIHCLAGAHRAGTAGIACLMYLLDLPYLEALSAAKRLRPIINPIGQFPRLLGLLEEARKTNLLLPRRSTAPLAVPPAHLPAHAKDATKGGKDEDAATKDHAGKLPAN